MRSKLASQPEFRPCSAILKIYRIHMSLFLIKKEFQKGAEILINVFGLNVSRYNANITPRFQIQEDIRVSLNNFIVYLAKANTCF